MSAVWTLPTLALVVVNLTIIIVVAVPCEGSISASIGLPCALACMAVKPIRDMRTKIAMRDLKGLFMILGSVFYLNELML
jgi:hypothetical protein